MLPFIGTSASDEKQHSNDGEITCNSKTPWSTHTNVTSPSSTSSPSSVYLARLSCHATTARAASSVSRAATRTWARRTNLPMTNTAQWRSAKSAGAPCSALTEGAATAASMGRGTARWIATAWCRSSARGRVDAFCLR